MSSEDWFWLTVGCLVFAGLGIALLFFTRDVWHMTVGLSVKGDAEPSDSYLFMAKLSGIAYLVLVPVSIIYVTSTF